MTASEHVLILLSLVVSLALAHILSGIARLIQAEKVTWSWLHGVWVVLILLLLVDFWISVWQLRLEDNWNILTVLFWMVLAILLYLISALVVPDQVPKNGLDLHEFHDSNRSRYLGLFLLTMPVAFVANFMLEGFALANIVVVLNLLCLATAAFSRKLLFQWMGTIGVSILYVIYFATFMADF